MVSWQGVTSRLKRLGGHKLRSREKFSQGYLKLWKLEFHLFLSEMIWNKHHKFSDYSHRDQSILLHMNWSTVLKRDGVIHEGRKMDWRGQRQRWRRKSIFEQKKTQWWVRFTEMNQIYQQDLFTSWHCAWEPTWLSVCFSLFARLPHCLKTHRANEWNVYRRPLLLNEISSLWLQTNHFT